MKPRRFLVSGIPDPSPAHPPGGAPTCKSRPFCSRGRPGAVRHGHAGCGRAGPGVTALLASVTAFALLPPSAARADFVQSMWETKPGFEFRFRHEYVDQDDIDKQAQASTAKARLSWVMPAEQGFSVGLEGDYVFVLPPGASQKFNSTENGRTGYPVVADPTGFDVNLAFLKYRTDAFTVTAGRQRIAHFEQRFIGAAGWRQNEQTYDALRLQSTRGKVELDYSYVMNVNRVFGPGDGAQPGDWKGDSHFLRASLKASESHSFGAFAYLLDFENDNGPANSTATYGMDYHGTFGPLTVKGSIARQTDWARSPLAYDAMHYWLEGRLKTGATTFAAGYEVLGSDGGTTPFRTPLGSLHKFQGWADKFIPTPAAGVADAYVSAETYLGPALLILAFHDFQATDGGADFGREVGLCVDMPLGNRFAAMLKFAYYDAAEHASNTTKLWLMLSYRL